ncbi:unnamed protein product [Medioppia subpectinata]|uniref:Chitinase n=1 Tax=Medioppia subpectinata TaxID=1979941 RepID=A0A7R9KI12_9ACAR|nr:unnamed protein product [Medioppia subpectinata]CAG2103675.1 unnamed protein product [Medioppia subpectinata]
MRHRCPSGYAQCISTVGDLKYLSALKQQNPALKVLLSLRPSNNQFIVDDALATNSSADAVRTKFARRVREFVDRHGIDGVDLDWEYFKESHNQITKRDTLLSVLRILNEELKPLNETADQYLLTITVSKYARDLADYYDFSEIYKSVDFVNLPTFNFDPKPQTLVHPSKFHGLTDMENMQQNPALKVLLSLRPSNNQFIVDDALATNSSADAVRTKFARRVREFVDRHGIDGVDLDWEYFKESHNQITKRDTLLSVLRILNEELKPLNETADQYLLTITVSKYARDLADYYDFSEIYKSVDFVNLPTFNFDPKPQTLVHPSKFHGLTDMENMDSVIDLVLALGLPQDQLIIGVPSHGTLFKLSNTSQTDPGSPASAWNNEEVIISHSKICAVRDSSNWTLVREKDLTAPYIYYKDKWIGFDDEISIKLKAKYAVLRQLGGLALWSLNDDDYSGKCGYGSFPLLQAIRSVLTKPIDNINYMNSNANPLVIRDPTTDSSFVAVIEKYGNVERVTDEESGEESGQQLSCDHSGYIRHPTDCSKFYRCVKLNQLDEKPERFQYNCPFGLVFDERYELCNWPSWSPPCVGSGEIITTAVAAKKRFSCPSYGYFQDPEDCQQFYYCSDFGKMYLQSYQMKCPFDLGFDEEKLLCNWKWLVRGCGPVSPEDQVIRDLPELLNQNGPSQPPLAAESAPEVSISDVDESGDKFMERSDYIDVDSPTAALINEAAGVGLSTGSGMSPMPPKEGGRFRRISQYMTKWIGDIGHRLKSMLTTKINSKIHSRSDDQSSNKWLSRVNSYIPRLQRKRQNSDTKGGKNQRFGPQMPFIGDPLVSIPMLELRPDGPIRGPQQQNKVRGQSPPRKPSQAQHQKRQRVPVNNIPFPALQDPSELFQLSAITRTVQKLQDIIPLRNSKNRNRNNEKSREPMGMPSNAVKVTQQAINPKPKPFSGRPPKNNKGSKSKFHFPSAAEPLLIQTLEELESIPHYMPQQLPLNPIPGGYKKNNGQRFGPGMVPTEILHFQPEDLNLDQIRPEGKPSSAEQSTRYNNNGKQKPIKQIIGGNEKNKDQLGGESEISFHNIDQKLLDSFKYSLSESSGDHKSEVQTIHFANNPNKEVKIPMNKDSKPSPPQPSILHKPKDLPKNKDNIEMEEWLKLSSEGYKIPDSFHYHNQNPLPQRPLKPVVPQNIKDQNIRHRIPPQQQQHNSQQNSRRPQPQPQVHQQRDPIQRDPIQRDPIQRDPIQRDPIQRDPIQRDPIQRDPIHREPQSPDRFNRNPTQKPVIQHELNAQQVKQNQPQKSGSISPSPQPHYKPQQQQRPQINAYPEQPLEIRPQSPMSWSPDMEAQQQVLYLPNVPDFESTKITATSQKERPSAVTGGQNQPQTVYQPKSKPNRVPVDRPRVVAEEYTQTIHRRPTAEQLETSASINEQYASNRYPNQQRVVYNPNKIHGNRISSAQDIRHKNQHNGQEGVAPPPQKSQLLIVPVADEYSSEQHKYSNIDQIISKEYPKLFPNGLSVDNGRHQPIIEPLKTTTARPRVIFTHPSTAAPSPSSPTLNNDEYIMLMLNNDQNGLLNGTGDGAVAAGQHIHEIFRKTDGRLYNLETQNSKTLVALVPKTAATPKPVLYESVPKLVSFNVTQPPVVIKFEIPRPKSEVFQSIVQKVKDDWLTAPYIQQHQQQYQNLPPYQIIRNEYPVQYNQQRPESTTAQPLIPVTYQTISSADHHLFPSLHGSIESGKYPQLQASIYDSIQKLIAQNQWSQPPVHTPSPLPEITTTTTTTTPAPAVSPSQTSVILEHIPLYNPTYNSVNNHTNGMAWPPGQVGQLPWYQQAMGPSYNAPVMPYNPYPQIPGLNPFYTLQSGFGYPPNVPQQPPPPPPPPSEHSFQPQFLNPNLTLNNWYDFYGNEMFNEPNNKDSDGPPVAETATTLPPPPPTVITIASTTARTTPESRPVSVITTTTQRTIPRVRNRPSFAKRPTTTRRPKTTQTTVHEIPVTEMPTDAPIDIQRARPQSQPPQEEKPQIQVFIVDEGKDGAEVSITRKPSSHQHNSADTSGHSPDVKVVYIDGYKEDVKQTHYTNVNQKPSLETQDGGRYGFRNGVKPTISRPHVEEPVQRQRPQIQSTRAPVVHQYEQTLPPIQEPVVERQVVKEHHQIIKDIEYEDEPEVSVNQDETIAKSKDKLPTITGAAVSPQSTLTVGNGYPGVRNFNDTSVPESACTRAGLFQHPYDCNKYYECYWDKYINKFTLHSFECPVKLAFDSRIIGCGLPNDPTICVQY